MNEWRFSVSYAYGTLTLADVRHDAAAGGPIADLVRITRAVEDRCESLGSAVLVHLFERDGEIPVEVRLLADPAAIEAEWDHVAELSLEARSGRLQIYGWMADEDLAGEIDVPTESLRARIHWGGLEQALQRERPWDADSAGPDYVRVDLFPGSVGSVETLRTWHAWAPPIHESVTDTGLRLYRGYRAAEVLTGLESMPRRFWPPYPNTSEGHVTDMWRDRADGSRWARGSGSQGHPFLQELTDDEAERLEAEGFPAARTYATDADGRIWTSDVLPLERAPALTLIRADRWPMLRSILRDDEVVIVDLPSGWSRITARPFDGGVPRLVDRVAGDGTDAFYQRWPDGAEIPGR
ncbi:MAG TPA: hypothetical protein VGQ89_14505 [Candidatus Limnocylindrales bacterium]|nr:hypothetical protein [Candidatus Limnocylindrales bacterium]